ncbi:DMT family transporter [Roseisalinus antarcticus]|uniref:EamA-like transporter family protein n=1 Tax=Roseisalinus antarcticus TaxID=254357 RepID=A0A1Y5U1K6_9RHOB|nr:DMT family transporter [Roseisalinus antarcticus]SLN74212.1 EamA-like transporter family protein [Roseisalinus antarcticus]
MQTERSPIVVVIAAASAWGLFWLPLRAFEERGLAAGWTTLAVLAVPALVLLPFAILRILRGQPGGAGNAVAGLLAGGAVALYAESVLLTDVARALILFYVTPVWSTILELLILKRRITKARSLALILGLAGLVTILGGRTGFPLPQNIGDTLALLSGAVWACGSLWIRRTSDVDTFENVFSFFLFGSAVALCLVLVLPDEVMGAAPDGAVLQDLVPWLVLAAVAFMIPVMWGLLWGARHLDPGRLGILLQMEAVVGIGSAAVLTDEPFGLVEVLGTALVIGAGVADVLGSRPRTR